MILDEDEQESYSLYVLQTEYDYSLLGEQSLWKLTPPEINELMKGIEAQGKLQESRQNNSTSTSNTQGLRQSELEGIQEFAQEHGLSLKDDA